MFLSISRLILCLGLALLAGCALTPTIKPATNPKLSWQYYQKVLAPINHWQIEGLLGVRLPDKAQSANINWLQSGQTFSIELSGPLGLGATYLKGNQHWVSLKTNNGKIYYANSTTALMQQTLGWYVPVAGLYYWVRGLPVPGQKLAYQLNQYGLIKQLKQQGWLIDYSQYRLWHGLPLAGRLILKNQDLKVTLIINSWEFRDKNV